MVNQDRARVPETRSGNVSNLISVQTLDIILLHEGLDILLDIRDLGREARLDLLDDFLDELDVFHLLAGFHDAHDGGLQRISINSHMVGFNR